MSIDLTHAHLVEDDGVTPYCGAEPNHHLVYDKPVKFCPDCLRRVSHDISESTGKDVHIEPA